jgi:hypothetical protein
MRLELKHRLLTLLGQRGGVVLCYLLSIPHNEVTLEMSSKWFTPTNPSSSADKPPTFWPASPSNQPLVTPPPAAPQEPSSSPFPSPSEQHYFLHPPGYIYYPTTSHAKIYALAAEDDRTAFRDPAQNQYDWIHPFSSPVYKVPAKAADVWNTVRYVVASKWERGEEGTLSAAMRRALVDVVEEAEEKEKKGKGK